MNSRSTLFKFSNIPRSILLGRAALLFSIGFIFLIEQIYQKFPYCYDATNYQAIAKQIEQEGILRTMQPTRTLAYPWILSITARISQVANLPEIFLIFLLQITTYYLAVLFISNILYKYSSQLAAIVYLALCLNVFVIPYTGVTLTDSLYTSLGLFLFAGMIYIETLQKSGQRIFLRWIFLGVFLISFAITIRPAAIWFIIPAFYCMGKLVVKKNIGVVEMLSACILGCIPLYIQIVINTINYKVISFLPVNDLGGMQIKWGIEYIKYGTWMGVGDPRNFYSSKLLLSHYVGDFNLGWYFHYPMDGIKLVWYKLIGAFDFDYLLPYPYQQPKFKCLASFFSFSLLWMGILGVFFHLITSKIAVLGSRWMPFLILFGWGSVALSSALELRFTLPLLTYFIITSCSLAHYIIVDKDRKMLTLLFLGWFILMPLFYNMALFIRQQSAVHF